MPGDEFEIVPKKEIEGLKKDIEGIKSDPLGAAPSGKNLAGSVEKLTDSMDNMFELFKVANKEIKEEASSLEFMKQIAPLFENLAKKMEKIIGQHDKIAEGIVAVADMVREMKEKQIELAKKEMRPVIVPEKMPPPTPATITAPRPAPLRPGMPPPPPPSRQFPGRAPLAPPR